MTAGEWPSKVWPEFDWAAAVVAHGAFHRVTVLAPQVVCRVAEGVHHAARTAREASILTCWRDLVHPAQTPVLLAGPVTSEDRTGILTTYVSGRSQLGVDWPTARAGFLTLLGDLGRIREEGPATDLPVPRAWCGGEEFVQIVIDVLAPLVGRHGPVAVDLTAVMLESEAGAGTCLLHGDLGLHNVLWMDDRIGGVVDLDHSSWGDPAIDIAPLIGSFGLTALQVDFDPELLRRALHHRATLPLQVAAAAYLSGNEELRDHALHNFADRIADGTQHDPGGRHP